MLVVTRLGEADDNNCYAVITCSVSGATCTGATDASADYTCTASIEYHADPTTASTEFPAEDWLTTVIATDDLGAVDTEIGVGVEMNSLLAYDATGSINYGSLTPGNSVDLTSTVDIQATGNVGIDAELSGTDLTDGGNTIPVANQEYASTASVLFGSGTDLSGVATEVEFNIAKTTVSGTPAEGTSYWGLLVPGGTLPGSYTGTNTITAVLGEVAQW